MTKEQVDEERRRIAIAFDAHISKQTLYYASDGDDKWQLVEPLDPQNQFIQ